MKNFRKEILAEMIREANEIEWNRVKPDFIYNRYDITYPDEAKLLEIINDGESKYIPLKIIGMRAEIGSWRLSLSNIEIDEIVSFIFSTFKKVNIVYINKFINDDAKYKKCNDYYIVFPDTIEEFMSRLTAKSRANLKREYRILNKECGEILFEELSAKDALNRGIIKLFFEMKYITHQKNYKMSDEEYIKKYYVSNVYTLIVNGRIIAIINSCEQTPIVYLENLTYDLDYAAYSPGKMIYNLFLKRLVEKGCTSLYLGGGNLEYKKRYGSIETILSNTEVYRYKWMELLITLGRKIRSASVSKMCSGIQWIWGQEVPGAGANGR